MPTNTWVWRLSQVEVSAPVAVRPAVVVWDLDRGPVDVEPVLSLAGRGVLLEAWRPTMPLPRGAEIEVRDEDAADLSSTGNALSTAFVVGEDIDVEPPDPPTAALDARWISATAVDVCEVAPVHEVRLLTGPPDALVLAIDAGEEPDAGTLPDEAIAGATDREEVWIRGFWPMSVHSVSVAGLDFAGNLSAWAEPFQVRMPSAHTMLLLPFLLPLPLARWRRTPPRQGPTWGRLVAILALSLGVGARPAAAEGPPTPRTAAAKDVARPGFPGKRTLLPVFTEADAHRLLTRGANRMTRRAFFRHVAWRQGARAGLAHTLPVGAIHTGAGGAVLLLGWLGVGSGQPGAWQTTMVGISLSVQWAILSVTVLEASLHLRESTWEQLEREVRIPAGVCLAVGFAVSVALMPRIVQSAGRPTPELLVHQGLALGFLSGGGGSLALASWTLQQRPPDPDAAASRHRRPAPRLHLAPAFAAVAF
jgi:hypothetical protein